MRVIGRGEQRQIDIKLAGPNLSAYKVITPADMMDSTYISNRSRRVTWDWKLNPLADDYAMTSDFDDRWRTGGTLDEVIEEAHLSPEWLLKGIERFAKDRDNRLKALRELVEASEKA